MENLIAEKKAYENWSNCDAVRSRIQHEIYTINENINDFRNIQQNNEPNSHNYRLYGEGIREEQTKLDKQKNRLYECMPEIKTAANIFIETTYPRSKYTDISFNQKRQLAFWINEVQNNALEDFVGSVFKIEEIQLFAEELVTTKERYMLDPLINIILAFGKEEALQIFKKIYYMKIDNDLKEKIDHQLHELDPQKRSFWEVIMNKRPWA